MQLVLHRSRDLGNKHSVEVAKVVYLGGEKNDVVASVAPEFHTGVYWGAGNIISSHFFITIIYLPIHYPPASLCMILTKKQGLFYASGSFFVHLNSKSSCISFFIYFIFMFTQRSQIFI